MPIWSSCCPVLCRFLSLCEQYGLLSKDVKAAARLDGQEPLDQNTKRLHKVQRFKREREIKAKLANAQMKRMRIAQLEAEVAITHSSVIFSLMHCERFCHHEQSDEVCFHTDC